MKDSELQQFGFAGTAHPAVRAAVTTEPRAVLGGARHSVCSADHRSASRPRLAAATTGARHANTNLAYVLIAAILILTGPLARAADETPKEVRGWANSIVTIEVARKQYDYYQPWSKRTRRMQKVGVVIGEREILTTADELYDRTLVRLQKNGRSRWALADVTWIDYPANLALLTTSETDFWKDLKPASLASGGSVDSGMQVVRWREGKLENRRAEFTQYTVREGQLSGINQAVLEASSEIQGIGWGEPLVADSKVLGLVTAQDGRNLTATPASFIRAILEARKKNQYHGLGYFHFFWQQSENPDSLARLKLPGEPRGVIIIDVPDRPDHGEQVLKPQDILLQIDKFPLDIQGDYNDPDFGHLMLESLSTRGKWAGDDFKMQIWRDGKQMDVTYRLPKFAYTNFLVPGATYDQEPEYFIIGGLVFQPLTDSYLESWGSDWKRRAPFRLNYYRNESPSKESPALLLLSQVLPDPYNIGYQDQRYLILDKVNGQPVHYLSELQGALEKPADGFHVFEFVPSDSLRKLVLASGDAEQEATARVLKRYGITEASRFSGR